MKKLLTAVFLITYAAISLSGQKAERPVISVETSRLSMVMSVSETGELLFQHFGGKINDPAPFLDLKTYRRSDLSTDNLAYSAYGGRNLRETALLGK